VTFYALVRGPLGVGKTTIATALASAIGGVRVSIDEILDRPGMEEWEDGRITEASFLRVNEVASELARPTLERGTPVVFDGNFYYRSQVDDLLGRLGPGSAIFSLRAPLVECIDRDRRRPHSYGEQSVREVFGLVERVDVGIPIDARGTAAETLDAILERVRAERPELGVRPPR
jgi:hypothetical protein